MFKTARPFPPRSRVVLQHVADVEDHRFYGHRGEYICGLTGEWERMLGLGPGTLGELPRDLWRDGDIGRISEAEAYQGLGEILGISEVQVHALMDDMWLECLGTPNLELMGYFRSLRPKFQTAILSNSFVGAREREEERCRFSKMCDFIVYSHEVGLSKPDPRIFALTCERLGLAPREVIFLDDVEGHINAAREFGIHGIIFRDNAQAIAKIEAWIQANACGM